MARALYVFLILSFMSSGYCQDRVRGKNNEAVGYSTRDATVLSMVGWGVILGVISAGVSVLFSEGGSSSHSH